MSKQLPARRLGRLAALGAVLALAASMTVTAAQAASAAGPASGPASGPAGLLGPNVTVFDPGMPVADIQATLDAVHAAQVDNEMGTQRYAFLFKPGTYGTA